MRRVYVRPDVSRMTDDELRSVAARADEANPGYWIAPLIEEILRLRSRYRDANLIREARAKLLARLRRERT